MNTYVYLIEFNAKEFVNTQVVYLRAYCPDLSWRLFLFFLSVHLHCNRFHAASDRKILICRFENFMLLSCSNRKFKLWHLKDEIFKRYWGIEVLYFDAETTREHKVLSVMLHLHILSKTAIKLGGGHFLRGRCDSRCSRGMVLNNLKHFSVEVVSAWLLSRSSSMRTQEAI